MGVYKEGKTGKYRSIIKTGKVTKRENKKVDSDQGRGKGMGARLSSTTEPGCRYRIRELSGDLL